MLEHHGPKEECHMNLKLFLRSLSLSCLFFILLCGAGSVALAEGFAPGCPFPVFTLPAPESPQVQSYLGLKTMEPFSIADVRSKVILIEFLNAM
jgi:hypothetical protein